jgi:hypothetical protein
MNKQPLQSLKLIIHKATFFWNNETKKQQVTVCGCYSDQDARHIKSVEWDQVNCKRCLSLKEETPISTMSL